MNNLDKAAQLLEDGSMWCAFEMLDFEMDDDNVLHPKVCLIGAVTAAILGLDKDDIAGMDEKARAIFEDKAWGDEVKDSKEIKVLGDVITEEYPNDWHPVRAHTRVFDWNDSQNSSEPVVDMLRKAAVRLENEQTK